MNGRFVRPFCYSALPFILVMVLFELLLAGASLLGALMTAGLSGLMFGGAMGALNASTWIRDWVRRNTQPSLEPGEEIRTSGFANRDGHRGMLYLTTRHLRFNSHPFNAGPTEWVLPLSDVQEATPGRTVRGLVPDGITLQLQDGETELLSSWEREEWCDAINEHVGG